MDLGTTLTYTRVSMCFSPRYSLQGRSPALPAPLNAVKWLTCQSPKSDAKIQQLFDISK